jgi:hypothetical protein
MQYNVLLFSALLLSPPAQYSIKLQHILCEIVDKSHAVALWNLFHTAQQTIEPQFTTSQEAALSLSPLHTASQGTLYDCYCITPSGEEDPCQFTSSLWFRRHQRRPLCILLYCTHTPILTSHTHTPPGFSSALPWPKSLFTAHIKWYWPIFMADRHHTPISDECRRYYHSLGISVSVSTPPLSHL